MLSGGTGGSGGIGGKKAADRKSARARTVLSEKQLNILKVSTYQLTYNDFCFIHNYNFDSHNCLWDIGISKI